MSSQQKVESARSNGAKSHGPKTGAGRAKSALNSITHGLYSKSVVLSIESAAEHREMLDSYLDQLQPAGPVEFHLVEEMVAAKWRQRRIWAIQAELLDIEVMNQESSLDEEFGTYEKVTQVCCAYRSLAGYPSLPFLVRSESRLERTYTRALKNLLELHRLRNGNRKGAETNPIPTSLPNPQPRAPDKALVPPADG